MYSYIAGSCFLTFSFFGELLARLAGELFDEPVGGFFWRPEDVGIGKTLFEHLEGLIHRFERMTTHPLGVKHDHRNLGLVLEL